MIKKYIALSLICILSSWTTTHGAVPIISTNTTIAYDSTQKKIGYTPSGTGAKFVDCGAGFTIAADTIVTWNVPPTVTNNNKLTTLTVTGPITFNASSAQLKLNNNLQFSGSTGVFAVATTQQSFVPNIVRANGNATAYAFLTIDTTNITKFPGAIVIPPYTKVTWAATKKTVGGAITIADTSSLTLSTDLLFAANGSIATDQFSRIITGDYKIYTSTNTVKMASITDANYKNFTSGFTIAANTCYRWATSKPLTGTIIFTDGSYSQLILDTDLIFGKSAKIDSTANSTPKASINTRDYGLIFEDELTILNTLDLVTN